jgi:hypothetical protein
VKRLIQLISTAGVCAVTGSIAGALVGGLYGLFAFVSGNMPLTASSIIETAIGLSLLAWVAVLLIVGVLGDYGAVAIAGQALVTCVLTGVATVELIHALHAGLFGMLLGWIVGFLIGKALCAFCGMTQRGVVR